MAVAQGAGLVRLDCPACKGNFYYIDGSMAGQCPYCQTPLLALTRDRLLRFVIPQVAPRPECAPDAQLVLLPFWRLAALIFGWDFGSMIEMVESPRVNSTNAYDGGGEQFGGTMRRDSGPKKAFRGTVVDRALPDPATEAFGVRSLGLRAAVHPKEPMTAAHEQGATVVPSTLEVGAVRERLYGAAMRLGRRKDEMSRLDCQRADIVGEALSILYYPFWARRTEDGLELWDGVNGDPEPLCDLAPRPEAGASTMFDEMSVIEGLCGQCGEPLPAGNRAVIWPCTKCHTFWVATRDGLDRFEASYARPLISAEDKPLSWLPFWQVQAEVDCLGRTARQSVDVRNVLGVHCPRGDVPGAPPEAPLCYFVPAYGSMRAPRLDYAARDMTRHQPLLAPSDYAKGETYNCFFGPDDASRLGYVVMLGLLPGASSQRASAMRVRTGAVALWYVPFTDQGRELRNLLTGQSYDRTAFRGVGH